MMFSIKVHEEHRGGGASEVITTDDYRSSETGYNASHVRVGLKETKP